MPFSLSDQNESFYYVRNGEGASFTDRLEMKQNNLVKSKMNVSPISGEAGKEGSSSQPHSSKGLIDRGNSMKDNKNEYLQPYNKLYKHPSKQDRASRLPIVDKSSSKKTINAPNFG